MKRKPSKNQSYSLSGRLFMSAGVAMLLGFGLCLSARAEQSEFMKQGIQEFNAGNYGDAAGHFGAALAQDFNNAKLHYYMGNTYVHLKQREAAIREFRIAFALEPDTEVGKFSKQGLTQMGVESGTEEGAAGGTGKADIDKLLSDIAKLKGGKGTMSPATAPGARPYAPYTPFNTPTVKPSSSLLQEQAERLKSVHATESQQRASDAERIGGTMVKQTNSSLLDSSSYWRRGRFYQPGIGQDGQRQLDSIKHIYDDQKKAYIQSGAQQAEEVRKSAENLQTLMQQPVKPGSIHLSETGTNLYVRSYEETPGATSAATHSTSTVSTKTSAVKLPATNSQQSQTTASPQLPAPAQMTPPTQITPTPTGTSAPPTTPLTTPTPTPSTPAP